MILKRLAPMLVAIILFASILSIYKPTHSPIASVHSTSPMKQMTVNQKPQLNKSFLIKELHVVAIGDSLTRGVGSDSRTKGYVGIFEKKLENDEYLQVTVKKYGYPGYRSDQILRKLDYRVIQKSIKQADIVAITAGGNDIMKIVWENFNELKLETFQKQRLTYKDNLQKLINKIRSLNSDCKILIVGVYNPFYFTLHEVKEANDVVTLWNNTVIEVAEKDDNTTYVPIEDIFQQEKMLYTDYFHPNEEGYLLIANRVLEYMEESQSAIQIGSLNIPAHH